MKEDKETYRQRHKDTTVNWQQAKRQRGVQADMNTWMLTKCRQTTEMDEKLGVQADKQTNSQVGGENDRQTGQQAGINASWLA